MPFILPKTCVSDSIFQGGDIYKVDITIYFTGTIDFEITADASDGTPTWEKVSLISGVLTSHTFTVSGDNVKYRIVSMGGVISAQQDSNDQWVAPGISIKAHYN